MHYFIDGYNLLFRLLHGHEDLKTQREMIITDLNKKISVVKLNISIVFDAPFQIGERSRHHFNDIEILFTDEGETADEYILDEIRNSSSPENETVVTSDKVLAGKIRLKSAFVESVEDFISRLNRMYKNKLKQTPKNPPLVKALQKNVILPPENIPLKTLPEQYAQIFELKFQELIKQEEETKKAASEPEKRKRKPRTKKKTFPDPQQQEVNKANEIERWLHIFEQRMNNE